MQEKAQLEAAQLRNEAIEKDKKLKELSETTQQKEQELADAKTKIESENQSAQQSQQKEAEKSRTMLAAIKESLSKQVDGK